MLSSVRVGVATVAEHDVSRCHRKAPPRLASMHIRQLKEVTLQGRQVNCVMDSPIGSRTAGFGNCRDIYHSHSLSSLRFDDAQTSAHLIRTPPTPFLGGAQPFENRR